MAHKLIATTSSVFGEGKRTFKSARPGEEKTVKRHKTFAWGLLSALVVLTMLVPTTLSVVPMPVVQAADTGWHSPTSNAATSGGDNDGFEINAQGAYADDGDYASNVDGPDDRHLYYNFGFGSFPVGAVITGVEVYLEGGVDTVANSPQYEVDLSWNQGSSWSSVRSASLEGTLVPAYYVLGGQSDLWGRTAWSANDFLNANFRVRITSRATEPGSENRDFYLDWVAVRVTYASAHIDGTVWSDDDADGIRDGGEAGLESIHVAIYQDDGDSVFEGGSDDLEVGSDDTGVDGTYDTGPFMDGYSYWIDVDDPAYYTLTTPPEPRLVSLPDGNSVSVDFGYAPPHPGIAIAKTPDEQILSSGSAAAFTIAVTNTGDVVLTDVTVSDARAPLCGRILGTLPVGGHTSYGCALANVTDGFINSAVATGTPPVGPDVTDTDAAKVRLDDTLTCPSDMVAYWNLDEASGSDYDDFYDGHDGECAGNCPTPVTGHINGGQVFNGSDTGVDVPAVPGDDSFDWSVNDSFSIEFWMRRSGTPTGNEVIIGRDDSATGLHWWAGIRQWAGNVAAFCLFDTGGIGTCVTGGTVITDGNWHHVVAIRDADADTIHIHVDGTEEDSTSTSYTSGFGSSTAALNIGWLNLSYGYHFDGTVDEVALYNETLSSDEIWQHYNEGLAGRWYCEAGTYAPVIVSDPVTSASVGRSYIYDVEAAGNPAPTYTLVISPTGMTIDPLTGLISWMPGMSQEGNHSVQVQASNSEGTDTQNFTVSVQEGTLCPTDMIAYWKLDETGAPYDDFYDGYDGECAGTCPASATGYINGGQEFSSTTGIDVPADEAFNWVVTDSFSIEFWMSRPGTPTGNEVVIGRDDNATSLHWWVGIGHVADDVADFCLFDTGGVGTCIAGTSVITGGSWHHVVAVRDESAGLVRIYVDGTEEDSASVTYTSGFDSATAALNIGWLNSGGEYHFNGIADEVALYDRALSPGEIQHHYNDREPGPGYCINPNIAVNKIVNTPVVYPWDSVTYYYTVTNPGDDALSSVDLSDDKCASVGFAGGDNDSDDELDTSETWIYTCTMALTSDITNIANVTGTFYLGGVVTATDMASVDVISPAIAVDKVADPTMIYPYDTVVYTYTVTNPGDDPLSVNLSDDTCSPLYSLGGDDNLNYYLDPGEIWTYGCTATVSADITNTVTVTGTDSADSIWIVTDTAFVDVINPAIEIAKTPDSQMIRYGSTVTFTVDITNTGDVILTNVIVSDALVSDCDRNNLPDLASTESTSYVCTQDNVIADFTNTAIVTGTPPIGPDVSDTDIALVDVISPSIAIAKTPDSQMVRNGSTATFTIAVTNTGDVMLTNVTVSDGSALDCAMNLGNLVSSESVSYTCTVNNVTVDFTNTVIVTGTPPVGPDVSDTDLALVDVINPSIEISKTPDDQMVRYDSTVTFTISVTNTGDVTLTDVTVLDALAPNCDRMVGTLVAGDSYPYSCAITNVITSFLNSATVTGTPPVGPDVSDNDTAFVDVINPYVEISKTPDDQMIRYGSTATFTITVSSISNTVLTDVTVSDPLVPDCDRTVGTLTAGSSYSYSCTLTDVLIDFTNEATVTGVPSVGPAVNDMDIARVDVISPAIAISKTPVSQTVQSNSTVTFTIAVTNTGDVILTDVAVLDVQAPNCSADLGSLAPTTVGKSYTCTITNVIANFTNTAIVTGTPLVGPDVSDSDSANVYVESDYQVYLPIVLKGLSQ